ncbi:MAG TPA: hypothetical protein ENN12_00260 [Epsilonproteobacteria bacterium]|nr:hypothetical protein [Campylobacterota bacterium]
MKTTVSTKSVYLFLFTYLLLAVVAGVYIYGDRTTLDIIRSDGYGYYSYLTTIFIDVDLSFKTAISSMPHGHTMQSIGLSWYEITGNILNKYTMGVAIMQLPFFMIAHLYSLVFGASADGYSAPYQIAMYISAVFYAFVGVLYMYKTLLLFTKEKIALISLVGIVFGTSLFHYTTFDATFSHVYSYFLVSLFVYKILSYSSNYYKNLDFFILGFIFGMIVITRVPNAILGLLFFYILMSHYHDSSLEKCNDFIKLTSKLMFSSFGALVAILPLLLYWHYATGSFLINSYINEGFNFLAPELTNYLFSIRKGLFFWSPLLLVSLFGFLFLVSLQKYSLFVLTLSVFVLHVYINASWWSWYFGGSFGNRVVVDILPVLAIPLAVCLDTMYKKIEIKYLIAFVVFFCVINILLMYAYWSGYIPFDGTTAKDLLMIPDKIFMDIRSLL